MVLTAGHGHPRDALPLRRAARDGAGVSTRLVDPPTLDPGIRRLVGWLRSHGFETTDSGDGKAKADLIATGDALDFPHVAIRVSADQAFAESHRLLELTLGLGCAMGDIGPSGACIEVTYDPCRPDMALIVLMGVDDAALGGTP